MKRVNEALNNLIKGGKGSGVRGHTTDPNLRGKHVYRGPLKKRGGIGRGTKAVDPKLIVQLSDEELLNLFLINRNAKSHFYQMEMGRGELAMVQAKKFKTNDKRIDAEIKRRGFKDALELMDKHKRY